MAAAIAWSAVRRGDRIGIIGRNGSGKSTLLRCINLLETPTSGKVYVKGELIEMKELRSGERKAADRKQVERMRSKLAMVFQQFGLLPWRTVADNVGFGLELAGTPAAERKKRVAEQLALVGLDQWATKQVHELSGGRYGDDPPRVTLVSEPDGRRLVVGDEGLPTLVVDDPADATGSPLVFPKMLHQAEIVIARRLGAMQALPLA